jgi:hypothetical protein
MSTHHAMRDAEMVHAHGQGVRAAVVLRKEVLERQLALLQNSDQQSTAMPKAIELALGMVDSLLPGEQADISPVVVAQLVRWLDANQYLGIVDEKSTHKIPIH